MTFYFLKRKRCVSLALVITLLMLFSQITLIYPNYQPSQQSNTSIPNISAQMSDTKQWLNNFDFNSSEYWENETITDQINPDIMANISNNEANGIVLGVSDTEIIDEPLNDPNVKWYKFHNSEFPAYPTWATINSTGANVAHTWDEDVDQTLNTPSVHWKRKITMPVNMSDYVITSASVEVKFNATVQVDPWDTGGIDRLNDDDLDAYTTGDYAKFYVYLEDLENRNPPFLVGLNNTANNNLGKDSDPRVSTISDGPLDTVSEDVLVSYLTEILKINHYSFNITLGIDIYCEDNEGGVDVDRWIALIFKSFEMNITYSKKINQGTSLSWIQKGNKPNDLSPENYTVLVTDAILNFKYKLNETWPSDLSPNSEIRILINNIQLPETIKLSKGNTTYEDAKVGGYNVKSLILEEEKVNVSIQIFLADNFGLNRQLKISIDNVTLFISYTITTPDIPESDGGGGGTKYIRGEDYTWLVILLTVGIIALVSSFVAYQKHYKYPPIVRKIRALKKKIRKGKKTKPMLLNTREELIKKNFKNQTNIVMETELKPETIDKLKKGEG